MKTVYPRWRGEHGSVREKVWLGIGLSPLARGTQLQRGPATPGSRFIPAGAGNTRRNYPPAYQRTVYPRWRGEHDLASLNVSRISGLSPLARGTRPSQALKVRLLRFIPAGAGNTRRSCRRLQGVAVYPRWRGEHHFSPANVAFWRGLSPLARGTLAFNTGLRSSERFIPAGAGNTWPLCPDSSLISVYPRWRGEHKLYSIAAMVPGGLSPLARGTPGYSWEYQTLTRFIPAGAGNTFVALITWR
ncbi:Domain of uncharacterised function (DUF2825) [Atlantibacter hermannii]|nr:Domain of uncharacterised function (DUF2825) [Atlantibacter hermannii]